MRVFPALHASCSGVQPALSCTFTAAFSTRMRHRAISCTHTQPQTINQSYAHTQCRQAGRQAGRLTSLPVRHTLWRGVSPELRAVVIFLHRAISSEDKEDTRAETPNRTSPIGEAWPTKHCMAASPRSRLSLTGRELLSWSSLGGGTCAVNVSRAEAARDHRAQAGSVVLQAPPTDHETPQQTHSLARLRGGQLSTEHTHLLTCLRGGQLSRLTNEHTLPHMLIPEHSHTPILPYLYA